MLVPLAYPSFVVFEAFQHHQVTDKENSWRIEEIKNGDDRQLVFAKMMILAMRSALWCPFAAPFPKCVYTVSQKKTRHSTHVGNFVKY